MFFYLCSPDSSFLYLYTVRLPTFIFSIFSLLTSVLCFVFVRIFPHRYGVWESSNTLRVNYIQNSSLLCVSLFCCIFKDIFPSIFSKCCPVVLQYCLFPILFLSPIWDYNCVCMCTHMCVHVCICLSTSIQRILVFITNKMQISVV